MAGDKYIIDDQYAKYFITCTVVNWIDLFTRKVYRDIIIDSLEYSKKEKGLKIYAYVIMSNHIHLICSTEFPFKFSDFLRDFKKFTSKQFIKAINENSESRKEWLLDKFSFEARKTGRAENYKIWKDDNHAINVERFDVDTKQKIEYIHQNPVRNGLVDFAEEYLYSSARNYLDKKGLISVEIL